MKSTSLENERGTNAGFGRDLLSDSLRLLSLRREIAVSGNHHPGYAQEITPAGNLLLHRQRLLWQSLPWLLNQAHVNRPFNDCNVPN